MDIIIKRNNFRVELETDKKNINVNQVTKDIVHVQNKLGSWKQMEIFCKQWGTLKWFDSYFLWSEFYF